VTLILEVGTYKWHATHHLMMMHVSMKFHEILFNGLEVVVRIVNGCTLPYHNTSRFVKNGPIKSIHDNNTMAYTCNSVDVSLVFMTP